MRTHRIGSRAASGSAHSPSGIFTVFFLPLKTSPVPNDCCWNWGWGGAAQGVETPASLCGSLTARLSRGASLLHRGGPFSNMHTSLVLCASSVEQWRRDGAGLLPAPSTPVEAAAASPSCVCTILCALCPGPAKSGTSTPPPRTYPPRHPCRALCTLSLTFCI